MEERERTIKAAAKLLRTVYGEEVNVVAKILDAEALAYEGDDEGYETLINALDSVRWFVGTLVTKLKEQIGEK